MPFYEYECPHCSYHDEVLQKITDAPLSKCPSCGRKGLRKLMSAPVFRLKGSGWYETDFKSDKENKRNLHGTEKEESAAEKKDAAIPDAKAEPKAETAKAEATKADKPTAAKPVSRPAKRAATRAKTRPRVARKARR